MTSTPPHRRRSARRDALCVAAACVVVAGLAGCTSVKALPASEAPVIAAPVATLAPGDTVELKFPYAAELNDTQVVRPDGRLSLQLVGEVDVAGLEPRTLNDQLQKAYAAHLKNPAVTVILRKEQARRVFIGGEVRQPGQFELPAPLNVMEALTLAGGLELTTAAVGHVIVMRDQGDLRVGYRVDLRPVLRGEATAPFQLQPGDYVYVPRTQIVNVNQFMRQYVAGVIPRTGLIGSKNIGGGASVGLDTSYSGF